MAAILLRFGCRRRLPRDCRMEEFAIKLTEAQSENPPGTLGFECEEVRSRTRKGKVQSREGTLCSAWSVACGVHGRSGRHRLWSWLSLPEGASGFVTCKLKANFIGTTKAGGVAYETRLVHGGRTNSVQEASVSRTQ